MNINEIMKELAQWARLQEEAAATVEALKDTVKQYMSDNGLDVLTSDEHKATYKPVVSSRIDTRTLKETFPDVAALCTQQVESLRFTFK